jgi:hypothetical protein
MHTKRPAEVQHFVEGRRFAGKRQLVPEWLRVSIERTFGFQGHSRCKRNTDRSELRPAVIDS